MGGNGEGGAGAGQGRGGWRYTDAAQLQPLSSVEVIAHLNGYTTVQEEGGIVVLEGGRGSRPRSHKWVSITVQLHTRH